MRHRKKLPKLGRKSEYRKSLLANLLNDLILHGKIQTTEVKAKAVRSVAEKALTMAKGENTSVVIRRLESFGIREAASRRLMTDYVKRFANRSSGFTTLAPVKIRKGDNAFICQIAFLK